MTNWISIDDCEPNKHEVCIVSGPRNDGTMWVHFGEWEGKYWLDAGDEGYYEIIGVTHWMPLPEPPK